MPVSAIPSPTALATGSANRWRVPEDDFRRLEGGPVLCRLVDQSVLEFEGPDALSFLQTQTTADLAAMSMHSWQLGGYCTPKGRLLAIFEAWRYETGVRLLLPSEIAPAVLRRLSMYVLRAKVRPLDVSQNWAVFALCGKESALALRQAGLETPEHAWQCREFDGAGRIAALPVGTGCAERWLCLVPVAQVADWQRRLPQLPSVQSTLWWWTQIDAGVPSVFAATSELFVPQTLNLEVLGAVSFRKGCYPGQEIVARSQYLGKLRRRLALAHAPDLGPGPDIYASGKGEPVGRIVMAATAPGGGWDLLFECVAEAEHEGQGVQLHAGAADAPRLEWRALPYTIFDPTA